LEILQFAPVIDAKNVSWPGAKHPGHPVAASPRREQILEWPGPAKAKLGSIYAIHWLTALSASKFIDCGISALLIAFDDRSPVMLFYSIVAKNIRQAFVF
jgi:hypothetical protein